MLVTFHFNLFFLQTQKLKIIRGRMTVSTMMIAVSLQFAMWQMLFFLLNNVNMRHLQPALSPVSFPPPLTTSRCAHVPSMMVCLAIPSSVPNCWLISGCSMSQRKSKDKKHCIACLPGSLLHLFVQFAMVLLKINPVPSRSLKFICISIFGGCFLGFDRCWFCIFKNS